MVIILNETGYNGNMESVEELRRLLHSDNYFTCPEGDPTEHSEEIDLELGIRTKEIEATLLEKAKKNHKTGDVKSWGKKMHGGSQTWIGLHPQTLQTPYSEIWEQLGILKPAPNSHVVDLGAGYGRVGLVMNVYDESLSFCGFELVKERVEEGKRIFSRFHCEKAQIFEQNLMADDFEIPRADIYFIYDFGTPEHIRQILFSLSHLTHEFMVVARGKFTRSIIDLNLPWLSQVYKPEHRTTFSVYSNYKDVL